MKGKDIDSFFAGVGHGEEGPIEVIVDPGSNYEGPIDLTWPSGTHVVACVRCGGLVPDTELCKTVHDGFHDSLATKV